MMHQEYFYDLADQFFNQNAAGPIWLLNFSAEDSDFCRFNHAKIRQVGRVKQGYLNLHVIKGETQCSADLSLSLQREEDLSKIKAYAQKLLQSMDHLPPDPFINYQKQVHNSEVIHRHESFEPKQICSQIMQACSDQDMVGIFASGVIERGFANSLGQRNFFSTAPFNFDYSLYVHTDKAVKSSFSGEQWDLLAFEKKLEIDKQQAAALKRPQKSLSRGKYKAYLAPAAVAEFTDMLAWGAFSGQKEQTKSSSLLKLQNSERQLNPLVTMRQDHDGGLAPQFDHLGFVNSGQVTLIGEGQYQQSLYSPRSAKEYSKLANCDGSEAPTTLQMNGGNLAREDVLKELGEGIYINNLWYLNYSDYASCRMTGMTRFACFWVEQGELKAPLSVMRFDQSVLDLFGGNLQALTSECDLLLSPMTYGMRSTESSSLPGMLVDDFALTL